MSSEASQSLSVSSIMHKDIVSVNVDASARECAEKMSEKHVGCIIVVDDKNPVGIITERGFVDLVKKGNFDSHEIKAKDFMTEPLITIDSSSTYIEAMRKFEDKNIKRMPVVDNSGVVGLLTLKHLVSHSKKNINELQKENELLKKMAEQRGMTRE